MKKLLISLLLCSIATLNINAKPFNPVEEERIGEILTQKASEKLKVLPTLIKHYYYTVQHLSIGKLADRDKMNHFAYLNSEPIEYSDPITVTRISLIHEYDQKYLPIKKSIQYLKSVAGQDDLNEDLPAQTEIMESLNSDLNLNLIPQQIMTASLLYLESLYQGMTAFINDKFLCNILQNDPYAFPPLKELTDKFLMEKYYDKYKSLPLPPDDFLLQRFASNEVNAFKAMENNTFNLDRCNKLEILSLAIA